MTIEQFFIDYLGGLLPEPVYGDRPSPIPERFLTVEKLGGDLNDLIQGADIAVQSWAGSRADADELNETVKRIMALAVSRPEISRCHLTTDYNFPDVATRHPRYQAVFEVTYFL